MFATRTKSRRQPLALLAVAAGLLALPCARADVVTEWNIRDGQLITSASLNAPAANRAMAIAHTAAYLAANAITQRYPAVEPRLAVTPGASVDAAIAAAHHAALWQLLPSQRAATDQAYQAALATMADVPEKAAGIAAGELAAARVLALHAEDGVLQREAYRPHTTAGQYVPTAVPAASQWPLRRPWLMTSAAQFRPDPPPALASELWARDYNEVKSLGGRDSTSRSAEQTAIARFWEATLPPIYHQLVRCVADQPGRDVMQNARLFAEVTQATDDALIAIFDAKYHYGFWRPITAIRNGDIDGNDATERDASWSPFIDTPMHPEYPCAHCVVSAAIGAILQAEIGTGPAPRLATSSPTAGGAVRSWPSIEAFVQEVANARIYDGVHYRHSTEVGSAMGRKIGALAVAQYLRN
jgi:hypothetical protein